MLRRRITGSIGCGSRRYKARLYVQNGIYALENFHELSPRLTRLLDALIEKLHKEQVEVIFYLSPYHPRVYEKIARSKQYRDVIESEKYFRKLAQKYNCKVLGSYDPSKIPLDGSLFFDGMHVKEKGIEMILSGINEKNTSQP